MKLNAFGSGESRPRYSWDDLAEVFGFKPNYLGIAGGMPVSAATNSVLLITHPRGGASFDYRDYWDGQDLVYTAGALRATRSGLGQTLTLRGTDARSTCSRPPGLGTFATLGPRAA